MATISSAWLHAALDHQAPVRRLFRTIARFTVGMKVWC